MPPEILHRLNKIGISLNVILVLLSIALFIGMYKSYLEITKYNLEIKALKNNLSNVGLAKKI